METLQRLMGPDTVVSDRIDSIEGSPFKIDALAARLQSDAQQRDGVRSYLADKFHALETDQLHAIEAWLKQKPASITRAVPDPAYQAQALADIRNTLKANDRATISWLAVRARHWFRSGLLNE